MQTNFDGATLQYQGFCFPDDANREERDLQSFSGWSQNPERESA
jgi:hypothetical protein